MCVFNWESREWTREKKEKFFDSLTQKCFSFFFLILFSFFLYKIWWRRQKPNDSSRAARERERENPLFIQSVELDRRLAGIDVMRKRGCPKRKKRRRGLLRHWLLLLRQGGRCITKTKKIMNTPIGSKERERERGGSTTQQQHTHTHVTTIFFLFLFLFSTVLASPSTGGCQCLAQQ